jgi:phosphoserine phosphatase
VRRALTPRTPLLRRSCVAVAAFLLAANAAAEPLPSWRDTPARARIVDFVQSVVDPRAATYVPPAERVAVFDNDGTLWAEQPMYFQLAFALDRVRELAPRHPEWRTSEPFRSVLAADVAGLAQAGERGLLELVGTTHAGMTAEEFSATVAQWLRTARHPQLDRPYTELTYQPMRELLGYLRAHGFTTYIVSGGGVEFMRVFSERVYGVPPQQVIGSSLRTRYEAGQGAGRIVRLAEVDFVDDKAGKPVGIHKFIGRRPILAVGNSDGDFEMLEYVTQGPGPRLGLVIHHDDAEREFAYDRAAHFGRLQRALDEAPRRGWQVVSMRDDWGTVFGR